MYLSQTKDKRNGNVWLFQTPRYVFFYNFYRRQRVMQFFCDINEKTIISLFVPLVLFETDEMQRLLLLIRTWDGTID